MLQSVLLPDSWAKRARLSWPKRGWDGMLLGIAQHEFWVFQTTAARWLEHARPREIVCPEQLFMLSSIDVH